MIQPPVDRCATRGYWQFTIEYRLVRRYGALAGSAWTGLHPIVAEPVMSLIPVAIDVPAKGSPAGVNPVAAQVTVVSMFAERLDRPRRVYAIRSGDDPIAGSSAPPRSADDKGAR